MENDNECDTGNAGAPVRHRSRHARRGSDHALRHRAVHRGECSQRGADRRRHAAAFRHRGDLLGADVMGGGLSNLANGGNPRC